MKTTIKAGMIDDLVADLASKVDDSQVQTNVPAGAVFTDTVYTLPFADNSSNWNVSFGWGNHASAGYITSQRAITSTPSNGDTTTSISSDWAFDNVKTIVPAGAVFTDTVYTLPFVNNSSNWNTAYGWGDHGSVGYVTTDTIYTHPSYAATNINTSGATIVDAIDTNSTGHVTAMSTRTLALSDLGFTGDTNAQANRALASQAEAELGTDNTKGMTALRVAQAIAVLASGLQNKYDATTAPLVTNDASEGYSVGSFWVDVTGNQSYRCVDASNGAAKWIKTTLEASDLALVASSGDSDDLTEGSINLLMTSAERTKLSGIDTSANAYVHPVSHSPSIITQDASNRFFTDTERTKLSGIATGANLFVHPATHAPSVIVQDSSNRFTTDSEKSDWNTAYGWGNHASVGYLTSYSDTHRAITNTPADGDTTTSISSDWAFDNVKTAVPAGAIFIDTVYSHPANHPASVITQTSGARFVTDIQIAAWDAKSDTDTVYTHPSYNGDDIDVETGALTGATVVSDIDLNVTTDTLGHVVDTNAVIGTRTLTLANLGFTGDTNANYYAGWNMQANGAGTDLIGSNATVNFTGSGATSVTYTPATNTLDISSTDTDTVYSHPANHAISVITGLQAALDGKVDDSQVLTNVPSGALFTDTDTVYTLPFTDNSTNWDTAFGWGDHSSAGYVSLDNSSADDRWDVNVWVESDGATQVGKSLRFNGATSNGAEVGGDFRLELESAVNSDLLFKNDSNVTVATLSHEGVLNVTGTSPGLQIAGVDVGTGDFLPLSAGQSSPITGDLYIDGDVYANALTGPLKRIMSPTGNAFYFGSEDAILRLKSLNNPDVEVGDSGTYHKLFHEGYTTNLGLLDTANTWTASQTISEDNYIQFAANTYLTGGTLRVGGDGNEIVSGANDSHIFQTEKDLVLNPGTAGTTYLNYHSGTGGVIFGNGAVGVSGAAVSSGGDLTATSVTTTGLNTFEVASGPAVFIKNTTNNDKAAARFSDNSDSAYAQYADIYYQHGNTQSNDAGNSFHFSGTETSLAIILDQTAGNSGFYVGTDKVYHAGSISTWATDFASSGQTLTLGNTGNYGDLYLYGSSAANAALIKNTGSNLHIDAGAAGSLYYGYYEGSGNHYFGNGASVAKATISSTGHISCLSWACTSDKRKKKNVEDLTVAECRVILDKIRWVSFDWKDGAAKNVPGVIAQELMLIDENLVDKGEDGFYSANYFYIYNLQMRVSQDDSKRLTEQDARISRLEKLIEGLM